MKIKPTKKGLIVINPETNKPLPEDGETVTANSYWGRRVTDGDAVIVKENKKTKSGEK